MTETVSTGAYRRAGSPLGARRVADFRKAQRHSAMVRFVKRLLPVLLVGALVAMIAVPLIAQFGLTLALPFEVGAIRMSGTRVTMELPKLSGFTDDNRAYKVNAATASQDLTSPDLLDLTDISAQMELANKGWATVKSAKGTLDTKRQYIVLTDGVDLATNAGYAGHLKDAQVDAKGGTLVTDKPVVLTYRDGKLVADRMTVTDRGNHALFEGHVQLDFRMGDLPSRSTPQPAPGAGTGSAPTAPAVRPNR